MQIQRTRPVYAVAGMLLLVLVAASCAPDWRWCLLDGNCGDGTRVAGSVFTSPSNAAFTEVLIHERTFVEGRVVSSVTYRAEDMTRTPILVDFNNDRKADPVVGYRQQQMGVVQILLSYGEEGEVNYASLTLDGGENQWSQLQDLAVGDIDGDGALDIVIATEEGVVYLHHPPDANRTHVLSEWGQDTGALELIEPTTETITQDELLAIITQALGPAANADNYTAAVEQGYTSVEIGDFDNDGYNDIAASRRFRVTMKPKPEVEAESVQVVAGSVQVLINPGGAESGQGWGSLTVGTHERHNTPDREGAQDLRAYDLDGDGDLDLISTAVDDQNVQVAWFENPDGPGTIDPAANWLQHRIGSVRGAYNLDVADVTGDGRVDIIATSPTQMQMVLFVQPESVSDRGYDWYTAAIVDFSSYEPQSVAALDVDNDGVLELVVGGSEGALRYFESPDVPTDQWQGVPILTYDPPGDVGRIGYGDLDGDGDADLITVVAGEDVGSDRVTWVRNELIP